MRPYQTETLQPWQREIVERTVEVESGRFTARRLALITPRHKPFMPTAEMAATTGETAGDDPSPRQEWQQVIGLALAMIVAAFVLGYVVGSHG